MRLFLAAVFGVYLGIGAYLGITVGKIKAITIPGQIYIGVTWPAWFDNSPIHLGLPDWAFQPVWSQPEKNS